jgi:hypothetical protein
VTSDCKGLGSTATVTISNGSKTIAIYTGTGLTIATKKVTTGVFKGTNTRFGFVIATG